MELHERKKLIAKAEEYMKQNGADPLTALKQAEKELQEQKKKHEVGE